MLHLVTSGHFRSRDKDGGYVTRPHAARKHHGSMFDRTGVIADRSFTLQE